MSDDILALVALVGAAVVVVGLVAIFVGLLIGAALRGL